MNRKNFFRMPLILPFTIIIFICSCRDSPVENYTPKNQDEREIISLIAQYQDSKNSRDIERYLSLLHDEGEFTFECGLMVSKERLKAELPGFWAELHAGNTAIIPIVHECINGDYYTSGKLYNPEISIENNAAQATVLFVKGFSRVALFISMIRNNDRWLITRTEWGQS